MGSEVGSVLAWLGRNTSPPPLPCFGNLNETDCGAWSVLAWLGPDASPSPPSRFRKFNETECRVRPALAWLGRDATSDAPRLVISLFLIQKKKKEYLF